MIPVRRSLIRRVLLIVALFAALLAGATPAASARVNEPVPDWVAAAVRADFSVTPFRVTYTVYAGKNSFVPPSSYTATILKWRTVDISRTCVVKGSLGAPDASGYVLFDGSTHVECDAPGIAQLWAQLYPAWPALPASLVCPCNYDAAPGQAGPIAPLFGSADARLATGTFRNPVISAPDLGVSLSLPTNLGVARTRLDLTANAITSQNWSLAAAGNQVLLGGINGPAIVAADSTFGWLSYLNAGWKAPFGAVFGQQMRHWYQSPSNLTNAAPAPNSYALATGAHTVYIGVNPGSGEHFTGSIRTAIVDPGCPIS
jgi:hypothetical protein